MNTIQIIERENQKVLTTQQLAEQYETNTDTLNKNFNRNKDKYLDGKHYYFLQSNELKDFLQRTNCLMQNTSKIRSLYLWTEKGALLHAKSLNTDKAWQVYDYLVDYYFRAKEEQKQPNQLVKYYKGAPIITINDFTSFTGVDIEKHKLFFRPEYFTGGLDWNGLGQGSLRKEFEELNNVHYDEGTFIFMYESGIRKALEILKLDKTVEDTILGSFPKKIYEKETTQAIQTYIKDNVITIQLKLVG